MIKSTSSRCIIGVLLFCPIFSIGQVNYFLKTFKATSGYSVYQMPFPSIDTLSQNSFITGGFSIRASNSNTDTLFMDSFLQKTEISGLTKWHKKYHMTGHHMAFTHVQVLPDKDILVGGQTNIYYFPRSDQHGTLLRTDSNGYVKWFRVYPYQKIYRLLKMKNGDIAVLSSDSGGIFAKHLKLALLDKDGTLKWCKKYLPADAMAYTGLELVEGKDRRILILGYKKSPLTSFIIMSDSTGTIIRDLELTSPNSYPRVLYSATNYFDEGFYIVGFGEGNASNITGCVMKVNNNLDVLWYKVLQTQNGNSEFFDISVIGRNNLIIFNEPENYGTGPQRSGFTFIDSIGVARKNFLFTPDSISIIPDEFIQLRDGNMLFTTMGQYFGITDTTSNAFCKFTSITYPEINQVQSFSFNNFTAAPGVFSYYQSNLHLYLPIDQEIAYLCSSGPTGPLDTLILPQPQDSVINTTALNKREKQNSITIFPNPVKNYLFLKYQTSEKSNDSFFAATIDVINSVGVLMDSHKIFSYYKTIQLDLRNYSPGLYCVSIKYSDGKMFQKKIVVSK